MQYSICLALLVNNELHKWWDVGIMLEGVSLVEFSMMIETLLVDFLLTQKSGMIVL